MYKNYKHMNSNLRKKYFPIFISFIFNKSKP